MIKRNKIFPYILLLMTAAMSLSTACRRERILGKDEVANIMFEIFLADEYAKTYNTVNKAADSILLYQHVFDKHGCTLEDYQRSIKHYLSDEKAYSYILETATSIAREASKAAAKEMNEEKPSLYFPVPFKYPSRTGNVDDWWNKDFRGERITLDKFYRELKNIMVKDDKTGGPKKKHDMEAKFEIAE